MRLLGHGTVLRFSLVLVVLTLGLHGRSFAQAPPDNWIIDSGPEDDPKAQEKYDTNPERVCRLDPVTPDKPLRLADHACDDAAVAVSVRQDAIPGAEEQVQVVQRKVDRFNQIIEMHRRVPGGPFREDFQNRDDAVQELKDARATLKVDRDQLAAAKGTFADCFHQQVDRALEIDFHADKACTRFEGASDVAWCSDLARKTASAIAAKRAADVAKREAEVATRPLADLIKIPAKQRLPSEQQRIDDAVAACRKSLDARLEERRQQAATAPLDELQRIPSSYRIPEEQQRIAAEAAKRKALIASRKADKKWMSPVLSAALCTFAAEKGDAAKEIRTERGYAAQYGGVVDLQKIYGLQQQIRALDESISETRALARKLHAPEQGCGGKLIKQLAKCLSFGPYTGRADDCKTAEISDYTDLEGAVPWVDPGE